MNNLWLRWSRNHLLRNDITKNKIRKKHFVQKLNESVSDRQYYAIELARLSFIRSSSLIINKQHIAMAILINIMKTFNSYKFSIIFLKILAKFASSQWARKKTSTQNVKTDTSFIMILHLFRYMYENVNALSIHVHDKAFHPFSFLPKSLHSNLIMEVDFRFLFCAHSQKTNQEWNKYWYKIDNNVSCHEISRICNSKLNSCSPIRKYTISIHLWLVAYVRFLLNKWLVKWTWDKVPFEVLFESLNIVG